MNKKLKYRLQRIFSNRVHIGFRPMFAALIIISFLMTSLSGIFPAFAESSNQNTYTDKDETVYVTLNPDGTTSHISVVNYIRPQALSEPGQFVDYGNYVSIRPLSEDAMYTTEDQKITFTLPDLQEGFYYQGDLENAQLPFLFDIQYFLHGQELTPQEIVGKSGDLKIALNIRVNPDAPIYYQENYMCQIQMLLPIDRFSKIIAPYSSQFFSGKSLTLSYVITPGNDAVFEITANATLIETPEFTMTAIPFAIESFLSIEGDFTAEDIDALSEGALSLKDGMTQFKTGLTSLLAGWETMESSQKDFVKGQEAYKDGLTAYFKEISGFSDNLETLSGGISEVADQGNPLLEGYLALQVGTEDLFDAMAPILESLGEEQKNAYITQITLLNQQLAAYSNALDEYFKAIQTLSVSLDAMSEGSQLLDLSSDVLTDGLSEIIIGSHQFGEGLTQINQQAATLPASMDQMITGQTELSKGLITASDLFGSFVSKQTDTLPVSFADSSRAVHSVQIVLSVPSLTMAQPKAPEPKEEVFKNFWQRFLDLFR